MSRRINLTHHSGLKQSPYALVFGQNAMHPLFKEIQTDQNHLEILKQNSVRNNQTENKNRENYNIRIGETA